MLNCANGVYIFLDFSWLHWNFARVKETAEYNFKP